MAKGKGHLRHHTRRDGKKQPPAQGTALLLPRGEACAQCGGNTSHHPTLRSPIYMLPTPTPPPTHHPRGFALVHLLIVEITLIILLVLGCCTLVMPKVRMVLEEWHKLQSSPTSHASLTSITNTEVSAPSVPSPSSAMQQPNTIYNATISNASEQKEGKKRVLKRRRKRSGLCKIS